MLKKELFYQKLKQFFGRMRLADFDANVKHPAFLPKKSQLPDMIVRYYHEKIHHQGRGMTLNEVRVNGYWINAGSSVIGRHISRCHM